MSKSVRFVLVLVLLVWSPLWSNSQQQQKASCAEEGVEFCGLDAVESSEITTESSNNETAPASPNALEDFDENCPAWADRGECEINPDYMLHFCKKSCEAYLDTTLDQEQEDEDDEEETPEMAFGVRQTGQDDATRQIIAAAIEYMNNEVYANPDKYPEGIATNCRNQEGLCAYWAAIGECEKNPAYMKINCAPVCQTCDRLDFKVRCPLDPNATDALRPGDLDRMFERIISDSSFSSQFNITIHSRPYLEGAEGIHGKPLEEGQIEGPWVLTFEDFLTGEEADRMVELGFKQGYERSADVGGYKFDGTVEGVVSSGRTSTNAWCSDECDADPVTRALWKRIEQVTGIPENNSEQFQILRYEEGQFYNIHHDFIPQDVDRPSGARILTFFLYLSDVEEGGGTQFANLGNPPGLTVLPKKGKALLWPSVKNENPLEWDIRTHHAALPVLKGLKYACNAWIHMRDFKTPHSIGCT